LLKWWEENKHKYPIIAELAIFFLPIPSSSAPFERIWSQAASGFGLTFTNKWASLDENVSVRIILSNNKFETVEKV
jgi:hypothetical protein